MPEEKRHYLVLCFQHGQLLRYVPVEAVRASQAADFAFAEVTAMDSRAVVYELAEGAPREEFELAHEWRATD